MIPEEIQNEIENIKNLWSANLVMQQRNYDLLMALLSFTNKATADELFDLHNNGGLANPALIVPEYGRVEED